MGNKSVAWTTQAQGCSADNHHPPIRATGKECARHSWAIARLAALIDPTSQHLYCATDPLTLHRVHHWAAPQFINRTFIFERILLPPSPARWVSQQGGARDLLVCTASPFSQSSLFARLRVGSPSLLHLSLTRLFATDLLAFVPHCSKLQRQQQLAAAACVEPRLRPPPALS